MVGGVADQDPPGAPGESADRADGQSVADQDPLLTMRGIVKVFPGVRALDGVDLTVRAGEVHCLLGQNGAGKSTLIKILSGAYRPDEGEIAWEGEPITLPSPLAANKHGIATIYQELDLVDGLTVAENIFLGHELVTIGFSDRSAMGERSSELLAGLGHPEIRPGIELRRLSTAQKQIVSIARALSHEVRLLIMDEPSAVLDPEEVDSLFSLVAQLKATGVGIVYISHRLEEIQRIGDRISVLKDGRTVGSDLPVATTGTPALIKMMTGRSIEYMFPPRPGVPPDAAEILAVEALSRSGEFSDVSFSVRRGEIVGLAGLVGSGRSEILETIFGARRSRTGAVRVAGVTLRRGSVIAAVRAGIGLCPEERKAQGLLLIEPVYRNVTLASLRRFASLGWLRSSDEILAARTELETVQLGPEQATRLARELSGGNQQKSLLARWLLHGCRVLLLDEPTRGVDVGARTEIYRLVRRLADEGVAVVVVSSEIEEVLGLADRVLVIADGRVVHSGPATEIDEHGVLDLVMSGEAA